MRGICRVFHRLVRQPVAAALVFVAREAPCSGGFRAQPRAALIVGVSGGARAGGTRSLNFDQHIADSVQRVGGDHAGGVHLPDDPVVAVVAQCAFAASGARCRARGAACGVSSGVIAVGGDQPVAVGTAREAVHAVPGGLRYPWRGVVKPRRGQRPVFGDVVREAVLAPDGLVARRVVFIHREIEAFAQAAHHPVDRIVGEQLHAISGVGDGQHIAHGIVCISRQLTGRAQGFFKAVRAIVEIARGVATLIGAVDKIAGCIVGARLGVSCTCTRALFSGPARFATEQVVGVERDDPVVVQLQHLTQFVMAERAITAVRSLLACDPAQLVIAVFHDSRRARAVAELDGG